MSKVIRDRGPLIDIAYVRPGKAAAMLMAEEEKLKKKGATALKIEFRCEHENDTSFRIVYLRPETKAEKTRRIDAELAEAKRRANLDADPEYQEYQRLQAKFGDVL